jgi:hypothetical protein
MFQVNQKKLPLPILAFNWNAEAEKMATMTSESNN